MSSGSLKDLSKAITDRSAHLTVPLPDDLLQVIHAYLEKHPTRDESESQRLQDELFNIYQSFVLEHPARLAPFLHIMRMLKPSLQGSGRWLQWWDKLSTPVMIHLGVEKALAFEARDCLLDFLIYEEEETQATKDVVVDSLLAIWLEQTNLAAGELDEHASFVVNQIQLILIAYGKRRPKDFLTSINKVFVKKYSRISVLSLLCEFFRHQPPHLHELLQTPLFDNLLQCLQKDTSTRAISLAITALIMFLPHMPSAASKHLPALFNIYSRLLFWDRERKAGEILPRTNTEVEDSKGPAENQSSGDGKGWDKLSYLLESQDDTVPELLHYFTFLYGLYPINFMSYVRKPQRYLRHAHFPGADDLDVEPSEIRRRSEPFRQVHLLHPNFFMLTIESELTDNNRWMKSEAADVVAECMALYVPSEESAQPTVKSRGPSQKVDPNSDVPDHSLLDSEAVTPYQSRHTSWRNTQSTAVASAEGYRSSGLHRKLSQTSQSMASIVDSPSIQPSGRLDSPTLPSQLLESPSSNRLSDMLRSQKSARGSIYQALTNDSVTSLSLAHNHHESHVDAYLESVSVDNNPRSPSLRPTTVEAVPALKVAYLQREIQLLKNDLNFERYLKQQHLSHIGQLRRKQIRDARVEAETQNLLNSNRTLKSKLEEAKRLNLQMRKENEKSKAHSRKWESDLSGKLRILREEQKKWNKEREELKRDLEVATNNVASLKTIVVESESRELGAKQKVASVEGSLDELERLRIEVEDLKRKVIKFEAGELAASKAKEKEEAALNRVELLETELRSRDLELAKSKKAFEAQLEAARDKINGGFDEKHRNGSDNLEKKARLTQNVLDSALAASRARIVELQKAHNHLLKRYTSLQSAYTDLREHIERVENGDDALLGGMSPSGPRSSTPSPEGYRQRSHANSDPQSEYLSSGGSTQVTIRPSKLDTSFRTTTPETSPVGSPYLAHVQHFQSPQPFSPSGTFATGQDSGSIDSSTGKPKINPQSEVRVYGRGGVQNIGKKEKEKSDKGKEKDVKDTQPGAQEPKKEKKSLGIRGLRGFV